MSNLHKSQYAKYITMLDSAIGCLEILKEELLELKAKVMSAQASKEDYFSGDGALARISRARILFQQLLVRKVEASLKW